MVERLLCKQEVVGSIPSASIVQCLVYGVLVYGVWVIGIRAMSCH